MKKKQPTSKTTTVTQKGQITLPKAYREALGIGPYDTVQLVLRDKVIEVNPVEDILDLAGTFIPPKKPKFPLSKFRERMEKEYKRV